MIKKILLLSVVFLIITLPAISANENSGNFTELNSKIQDANETLILDKDYCDSSEIAINRSITIDGNGYCINNTEKSLKLNVSNDVSIIFKKVSFKNDEVVFNNENSTLNITLIDCKFKEREITDKISNCYYTSEVSQTIKNITKQIVGNLTGLNAAKKLAEWVGKNIKHETAPGFYQTPEDTLRRKLGNCASQSDLFLHMCEAIGLNKNHRMCFVHVGSSEFGKRHFFAMIDNILVDVDSKRNDPWGNAATMKNKFYAITEYPNLPIARVF